MSLRGLPFSRGKKEGSDRSIERVRRKGLWNGAPRSFDRSTSRAPASNKWNLEFQQSTNKKQ